MLSVSPKPEEVVGRIGEPDEAAGDTGHAAVQLNRVLAALFHLQRDVDGVGLRVALDVGGFVLPSAASK